MFEGLFQPAHLIIIPVIVLIVFGAGKLPDIGGAIGKSVREFKRNTSVNAAPEPVSPAPSVNSAGKCKGGRGFSQKKVVQIQR